jgi:hypothetical protein
MDIAPADSPKTVMLLGLPPNCKTEDTEFRNTI